MALSNILGILRIISLPSSVSFSLSIRLWCPGRMPSNKRVDGPANTATTLEMTRVGAPRDLGEFRTPTRIALTNDIRHPWRSGVQTVRLKQ